MSWSVSLCDPKTLEIAEIDFPARMSATGLFLPASRREAFITVTSNYDDIYRRHDVLGPLGLQKFNGMCAQDSVVLLLQAMHALKDDAHLQDYWSPTEGNAKRPLRYMYNASKVFPSGVWEVV